LSASALDLLPLMKKLIDIEVDKSTSEATLFRANSMAVALFQVFAKIFGIRYLWRILGNSGWELPLNKIRKLFGRIECTVVGRGKEKWRTRFRTWFYFGLVINNSKSKHGGFTKSALFTDIF
jgi:hypothetical protein